MMQSEAPEVLIVGAGLQGCSIALELARLGIETLLVDQDARPFERASLRNEGKIHLGLVYAADRSLETGLLQLRGALAFQKSIERWMDLSGDALSLSTPFVYLAAQDSLLAPEELTRHYEAINAAYRRTLLQDPSANYLGLQPDRLFRRLSGDEAEEWFPADSGSAFFMTEERAVDTDRLAQLFRKAIEREPLIEFIGGVKVSDLQHDGSRFQARGGRAGKPWRAFAAQVANTAWENWAALDRTLGLPQPEGLLLRLKYRVLVEADDKLRASPSCTMVLGRYGDVVMRPEGPAYLSWYPAGLRGWTNDAVPPREWDAACRGEPSEEIAGQVLSGTREGIRPWYPAVADGLVAGIDAGVIVACGRTDVDDPASLLHQRSRVGVNSTDGYHSVNAGKLTTAPMFAIEAAANIQAWRERPNAVTR